MLKGKLLIALASAVLFLGACSNDTTTPEPEAPKTEETVTPEVTETPETEEAFTGEVTYNRLYDATGAKGDVVEVTMAFENGAPTSVSIDVIQEDGSSKKEVAAAGGYVMKEGEEFNWTQQIEMLETFLTENNFDTTAVNITDEAGHTDAVTGVSIKVASYVNFVQELIENVQNGVTEFEFSGAKTTEFAGEKGTDVITVIYDNGQPVNLKIDNIQEDGSFKREAAEAGTYDMGGELNWAEQMDLLQAFIVENNFDLSKVTLSTEEGNTDAVTGVSIKVGYLLPLIEEALTK